MKLPTFKLRTLVIAVPLAGLLLASLMHFDLGFLPGLTSSRTERISLAIRVVDADTGSPIQGATAEIIDFDNSAAPAVKGVTHTAGIVRFPALTMRVLVRRKSLLEREERLVSNSGFVISAPGHYTKGFRCSYSTPTRAHWGPNPDVVEFRLPRM